MKRFIETLKNIWSIDELRKRILFALAIIFIYRLGSFIPLPGVNVDAFAQGSANQNTLLGLINTFSGGAFNQASIFALGIMPYITASIVIQLLGFGVPYFQRLQKEGESGRKKMNQITRILTIGITLMQGIGYLKLIDGFDAIGQSVSPQLFWISNLIILSAGTILAMWLGEKITDRGVGNGISILIMIGIIASLPNSIVTEFEARMSGGGGLLMFVLELAIFFVLIMLCVMIIQAVRKIPVQYANRMVGRSNAESVAQNAEFIPLKVNAAGVMPIIFAQAIMFLPATVVGFFSSDPNDVQSPWLAELSNPYSLTSSIIAFLLVVIFTYIYTALVVNPQQYAEYLRRQNAFIPGIKPGAATAEYIDTITSRITFPGSIFLGIITIIPAIAVSLGVNTAFAAFFGGTSLLILVGVTLDTMQQIESYLLMQKYDGLVQSGRIEGRGSNLQTIGSAF